MNKTVSVADEVEKKVVRIIADQGGGLPIEQVTLGSKLKELPLDSLDIVETTMAIEETFGLDIPDDNVEADITVGQVIEYVRKNI